MGRTLPVDVILSKGKHASMTQGMCVMEAVAYIAGERWSDHPACVSPVIAEFCRAWNDAMDDTDRQMLRPLIPLLVGTASDGPAEVRRSWMALDWLCRECAPAWLDAAGLAACAASLRALAPIESEEGARASRATLNTARAQADAARDAAWGAAWEAAWAAARDAARDAAWEAAWGAARDAARDAAWEAAWGAAWEAAGGAAWEAAGAAAMAAAWEAAWGAARAAAWGAAWDAAWDALRPTVVALQASALDLILRMADA